MPVGDFELIPAALGIVDGAAVTSRKRFATAHRLGDGTPRLSAAALRPLGGCSHPRGCGRSVPVEAHASRE